MRKRRKLKKKIKFILSLVILGIVTLFIGKIILNNRKQINNKQSDAIENIISYNENFSYDFLKYIGDTYGNVVLNRINDSYVNNTYDNSLWHDLVGKSYNVLLDEYNNFNDNIVVIDKSGTATISFIGDVSLADNFDIIPYYDSRNQGIYGILSTEVVDIMKSADIMVANNEFTISDRGTPLDKYYTFRAKSKRVSIYDEMGVDLVSIANNHAYDYGEDAFFDMLNTLKENNINYVGGGKNIDEARKAFYYVVNGYKFAFISATRAEKIIVTPGATEDSSGVFRCYDPELLLETIREEKAKSDYVVLLIHWGKEDSHELEDVQITTGKEYIDAGADLIVGSHAHVLQGMEYYKDKLIAYNLGDFIFNRETKDTGILTMNIDEKGKLSYKYIPCQQDNYKTILLSGNDGQNNIKKMNSYSVNVVIDTDGKISSK